MSEMLKKVVQAETTGVNMRTRTKEVMKENSETVQAIETAIKYLIFFNQTQPTTYNYIEAFYRFFT